MNYKILTAMLVATLVTGCNSGSSQYHAANNMAKATVTQPSIAGKAIFAKLRAQNFAKDKNVWNIASLGPNSAIDILQIAARKDAAPAQSYLAKYQEYIRSANKSIDIASLDSAPDNKTIETIAAGIKELSFKKAESPVEVRLILGNTPVYNYFYLDNAAQILKKLTNGINPKAKIKIAVGMYRTHPHSWNHAKILVVDGKDLITGGINFISTDYTEPHNPVNDLSVAITNNPGAAKAASKFLDNEWAYLCDYKDSWIYNTVGLGLQYIAWDNNQIIKNNCPKNLEKGLIPNVDQVHPGVLAGDYVISVGRLAGLDNWQSDASDIALGELLNQAAHTINISQQSLKLNLISQLYTFPTHITQTLCKKMAAGVKVNLLMSGVNGHPGVEKATFPLYSSNYTPETMQNYLAEQCAKDYSSPLNKSLLTIKVKPNQAMPELSLDKVPNHAKMVMVDGQDGRELIYIGSHNLYDGSHAEYGVIIDSPSFAKKFKEEYWNPNWR